LDGWHSSDYTSGSAQHSTATLLNVVGFESDITFQKKGIKHGKTGRKQAVDFCFAGCIFRLAATQSKATFK
jgi:hypothetical protein